MTTPAPHPAAADSATQRNGGASDEILDVRQIAHRLRVNRNHVYSLVKRNEIPHRRIGRFVRFHWPAVVAWFHSWSLQGTQERH